VTKVVIDTNIIFSILRSGSVEKRRLLFNPNFTFFAPQFIIVELFQHKERIVNNAKISESSILELLDNILQKIQFVNNNSITNLSYFKAFHLCKEVDEKDIPFVALAIEMGCLLWTNDEKLKIHLTSKGFTNLLNS
jgi:predicted nucleic acid-binding protein